MRTPEHKNRETQLYKTAMEALNWIEKKSYGFVLDVKDALRTALKAYDKKPRKKL